MARKAKDVVAPTVEEAPPQRVVAIDSKEANERAKMTNAEKLTAASFNLPVPRKGALVLDANAFIKGLDDYVNRADVLVTIPQVIKECKDRQTQELMARMPVDLIVIDPTPESVHKVVDLASLTGDLGALSRTDIRLCALGLDLAKHFNALGVSIKPRGAKINPDDVAIVDHGEQQAEADADEKDEESRDSDDDGAAAAGSSGAAAPPAEEEEEADFGGSDGEGEWITSENVEMVKGIAPKDQDSDDDEVNSTPYTTGFATATSDFPMQNVLLHLGVPVLGPAGYLIKELRQWLLRCHACYCLVTDTTRQFCPDCGSGDTLKRVSYIVNESGEKKLFINFKKIISKRGTVFTLPKPRGGRNGTNRTLVLREDQLANCGRTSEAVRRRAAAIAGGADGDDLKNFGEARNLRHDALHLKTTSSYKKYNVNEKKKLRAARRK